MRAIRRTIILCWAMLISCFIIKLFGGNWFEIICENEHFVLLCKYIDDHIILQNVIAYLVYQPSTMLMTLASANIPKPNVRQVLVIAVLFTVCWSLQFLSLLVKLIVEMSLYLILPIVLNLMDKGDMTVKELLKRNWYRGILGILFCFGFQAISVLTRNLGMKFVGDNTLIAMILMIDYYIMVVLYYLYIKLKKGEKANG